MQITDTIPLAMGSKGRETFSPGERAGMPQEGVAGPSVNREIVSTTPSGNPTALRHGPHRMETTTRPGLGLFRKIELSRTRIIQRDSRRNPCTALPRLSHFQSAKSLPRRTRPAQMQSRTHGYEEDAKLSEADQRVSPFRD